MSPSTGTRVRLVERVRMEERTREGTMLQLPARVNGALVSGGLLVLGAMLLFTGRRRQHVS